MNPFYVFSQAQQMMKQFKDPQQLVSSFLPDVPAEIRNDPNKIINWMQETGKVTAQQVQQAQQWMGRR